MLTVALRCKCTEKELFKRINFVMTGNTSYNLTIMGNMREHFEAEAPKSLLYNIHPMMIFQCNLKVEFQFIHETLGTERIVNCNLVDLDFANEGFMIKALKCLTSFLNKNFSTKPWNRQRDFDSFISPKTSVSLSYKDHRFNNLFQCCMVLVYNIDNIALYLDTYKNS